MEPSPSQEKKPLNVSMTFFSFFFFLVNESNETREIVNKKKILTLNFSFVCVWKISLPPYVYTYTFMLKYIRTTTDDDEDNDFERKQWKKKNLRLPTRVCLCNSCLQLKLLLVTQMPSCYIFFCIATVFLTKILFYFLLDKNFFKLNFQLFRNNYAFSIIHIV